MKKIAFILFIFIGGLSQSFAKLAVTPQYILFDTNNRERVKTVMLSNNSDEEKTYRIKLEHYFHDDKGKVHKIDENKELINKGDYVPNFKNMIKNLNFADKLFYYGPRKITLGPRETQMVKFQRKPLTGVEDGEYRSYVLFQGIDKPKALTKNINLENGKLAFQIHGLYGISIPLIVRKGNLYSGAEMLNLKKVKTKDGGAALLFDIIREGTKSLRGNVEVYLKDQRIGVASNVAIYLTANKREITIPLYLNVNQKKKPVDIADLKGKELTIKYTKENGEGDYFNQKIIY